MNLKAKKKKRKENMKG